MTRAEALEEISDLSRADGLTWPQFDSYTARIAVLAAVLPFLPDVPEPTADEVAGGADNG